MVFQSYALYPHLTVRKNLGFALKMRRESSSIIGERVNQVVEMLGLKALLDRMPAQLSGGEDQKRYHDTIDREVDLRESRSATNQSNEGNPR